ncbi:MAG: hypothetical protein HDT14_08115 [Oscillibacter sp.]|nr:hypothetical protein [Oscillibacter sp.]
MKDVSVFSTPLSAPQQERTGEQAADRAAVPPVESRNESAPGSLLSQGQKEQKTLVEMIQGAQEKAEAQREAMNLPKNSTRYGDAPLEAYARLVRAKSRSEVDQVSGYARRRLEQFKSALRTDSENSAKIRAAISQLKKVVNRGEKKKRELDRERLTEVRQKQAAKENRRETERLLRQELLRRRGQRAIRESGYMQEAEISDRMATQLTATQMELRQQAQELSASAPASLESAVQQYAAVSAALVPTETGFRGQA